MQAQRVGGACMAWASSRGLPSQLACHKSCEAVLSSLNKQELRSFCSALGLSNEGSTSQMILAAVERLVDRQEPLPPEYVSLNYVSSLSGSCGGELPSLRCWKCGASLEPCVKNIADFQVGSWPPGDSRRWRSCESVVIPSLICHAECARNRGLEEEEGSGEAVRSPSLPKLQRRRSCRVGEFATIVGLRWEERWMGLQEVLMLQGEGGGGGAGLDDGLISVPPGPCLQRVALQVLNWFSMSSEFAGDSNYLPARVYLTRRAKLCCRGGSVVGFITYTDSPDKHFLLPTINAIFVLPHARGKGACREMLLDFVASVEGSGEREEEEEEEREGRGKSVTGRPAARAGTRMGIEQLLLALPRVLPPATLKQVRREVPCSEA
eukprot:757261-Hanusia_phi.AAC.1